MEYRNELKFLVSDLSLERIKYRLSNVMEHDSHHKNGGYCIRSLYFDDYFDRCFRENLSGIDNRYKYRIRLYNGNTDYINLEKKYKYHSMTKKVSNQISLEKVEEYLKSDGVSADEGLPLELNVSFLKSGMRPKCIVEYDREAFVEPVGNVRITFDKDIRGSMDVERFLDFERDILIPVLPNGMHILEVKYDELLPRHILQVLDINNLQKQSISKYAYTREAF